MNSNKTAKYLLRFLGLWAWKVWFCWWNGGCGYSVVLRGVAFWGDSWVGELKKVDEMGVFPLLEGVEEEAEEDVGGEEDKGEDDGAAHAAPCAHAFAVFLFLGFLF